MLSGSKKIICSLLAVILLFSSSATYALAAITYTYDQNGNQTSDGTNCYEYNQANQLAKIKNCSTNQLIAEYLYDHEGQRIVKKEYENGNLKHTIYSPDREYETKKLANGTTQNSTYYTVNNEVVAKKNPDGSKTYFQNDHLSSNSTSTNQTGGLVENTSYYPYGNVRSGGTSSKCLFTGQEKDATGLSYYGARYYNSHIARFTQPDSILPNVYDPQQLNRYAYVRNNPLKYTDPSGNVFFIPFLIVGIGAASFAYLDEYNQRVEYAAVNNTTVAQSMIDPNFSLDGGRVANAAVQGAAFTAELVPSLMTGMAPKRGLPQANLNFASNRANTASGKNDPPKVAGVYVNQNAGGFIDYVGKTVRTIAKRAAEHANNPEVDRKNVMPLFTHYQGRPLTRWQISAIEQGLIEMGGGPNNILTNKINSINKLNPNSEYEKKLKWAEHFFKTF